MTKEQENIIALKLRYLEYYRELPVQKYAALSIGRTDDTIINWRNSDSEFSDAVDLARVEYFRRGIKKVKPEWALERLDREQWAPPTQKVETTVDVIGEVLKGFGITTTETTPPSGDTPPTVS